MNRETPPVLLLAYRRPETTRQVIDALRKVKPSRIYFAVDAPRPGDEAACRAVRELVGEFDWSCELKTNFRTENRGLRDAVESSIDWFFAHEESGIILEDDCVPSADFFPYCGDLLIKYENHPRVRHISGNSYDSPFLTKSDYRFSSYPHIWGWATWAASWNRKSTLNRETLQEALNRRFENAAEREYWLLLYDCVDNGKIDTWDFLWFFKLLTEDSICITPKVNLVSNVGFGEGATHTTQTGHVHAEAETGHLTFPLSHPKGLGINSGMDEKVAENLYHIGKSAMSAHLKLRFTKMVPKSTKQLLRKYLSALNIK